MTRSAAAELKVAAVFWAAYFMGFVVFAYSAHEGHSLKWIEKQDQACMPMCASVKEPKR